MEIKVIGVGPGMQEEAKKLQKAFEKALGVETEGPQPPESEDINPVIAAIQKALSGDQDKDREDFKKAKKKIKKALTAMRDDGIGIDTAAMALADVTCIFFNGLLKPVEGKTSKEAFMDFIGHVFDVTDEVVKDMRAKREAERCNGR